MTNGDANGRDYVHPTPVTAWQLIAGVIAVMVTMAMALWTIIGFEAANNKAIIDDVHQNYVQRTQHDDLVARLTREVQRVDALAGDIITRREFDMWRQERDKRLDALQQRFEAIASDHLTRKELENIWSERNRQVDALARDLNALRDQEEVRHNKIQELLRMPPVNSFSVPPTSSPAR